MIQQLTAELMSLKNAGSAQKVTKICYTEKTRNLSFRIQTADFNDLKECVKIINGYNEFDHEIINKALDGLANYKIYYKEGSPNNGHDLLHYDIGREGSPVMYIKLYNYYAENGQQIIRDDGSIGKFTVEEFKKNMGLLAAAAKADECSFDESFGTECRLWWD